MHEAANAEHSQLVTAEAQRLPVWMRLLASSGAVWAVLLVLAVAAASDALRGLPLISPLALGIVLPTLAVSATRLSVELSAPVRRDGLGLRTALLVFWQLRVLGQFLESSWLHPLYAACVLVLTLMMRQRALGAWITLVASLEAARQLLFAPQPGLEGWLGVASWLPLPLVFALALRAPLRRGVLQSSLSPALDPAARHWDDARWSEWALQRLAPQSPASTLNDLHALLRLTLQQVQRAIDASCALAFVVDAESQRIYLAEHFGRGTGLRQGPFPLDTGVLSAVLKSRSLTALTDIRAGFAGLNYRDPEVTTETVKHFVGLPILEGETVLAMICVERTQTAPFTQRDIELLERAGDMLRCALRSERVFVDLEFSKREQHILYEASRSLAEARDLDAVVDVALEAAAQVTPFDVALVTRIEGTGSEGESGVRPRPRAAQRVMCAVGEEAARLKGERFEDPNALAQLAVESRHPLPYRGAFDGSHQRALGTGDGLSGLASLFIVPLVVQDRALGTLILGARKRGLFQGSAVPSLQVLGNQLAVSLANAEAVARLENLATTDGLTGCLNKRAFLDALAHRQRAAERFNAPLSLIVTDIDHFKGVNDTYGHATGDRVLQRLGGILTSLKRDTDVVARFGGEEFCILCEQTDTEGARLLAERVREHLAGCIFPTEKGELKVTCSLGVATFPVHGHSSDALFEAADKALYVAKHEGRNQVVCAGQGARAKSGS